MSLRPTEGAPVTGPPLEIIAAPPKPWGRLWWLSIFTLGAFLERGEEHDSGWIVARNAAGRERRLFGVPRTELDEKRQRVEREMPLGEWRRKYGVPADFVNER